MTEEEM